MTKPDTLAKLAAGQRVTWSEAGFKAEARIVRAHKNGGDVWLIESASGVHWVDGAALAAQALVAAEPDRGEPFGWIYHDLAAKGETKMAEAVRFLVSCRKGALEDAACQANRRLEVQAELEVAQQAAQAPDVADGLDNIESPFNACMHQHHCKQWKQAAQAPEGWVMVPKVATTAMLRPFYNCPPDELQLAWEALLLIAAAARPQADGSAA